MGSWDPGLVQIFQILRKIIIFSVRILCKRHPVKCVFFVDMDSTCGAYCKCILFRHQEAMGYFCVANSESEMLTRGKLSRTFIEKNRNRSTD